MDIQPTNDILANPDGYIDAYRYFFLSGIKQNQQYPSVYRVCSNLGYNTQYLSFISNCLSQEEVYAVYERMLIKSFVVVSGGIVECLLDYEIRNQDLGDKDTYEEVDTWKSNEKIIKNSGVKVKVETKILKETDSPIEKEMKFERLQKIGQKNKIFGLSSEIYAKINGIRKLRNKVHLQMGLLEEHDYNSFNRENYEVAKEVLKAVFDSSFFENYSGDKAKLLNFLEPKN